MIDSESPTRALRIVMGFGGLLSLPLVATFAVFLVVGTVLGNGSGSAFAGTLKAGAVPAEYAALYEAAGHLCPEVSPALLAAQGKQESGFDPHALSPVGAMGIAQFMPATWARYGNGGNVWDPKDAIPAQARYDCDLAQAVKGIPGDAVPLMLAAYNAGPYAVLAAGGIPPFAETRNYVSRILALVNQMTVPVPMINDGSLRSRALAVAMAQQGKPYQWGGAGPDLFDCSGLVIWSYQQVGLSGLPHSSQMLWDQLPHVDAAQAQYGDLVFAMPNENGVPGPGHVGFYLGNGQMLDAPHTGAVVRVEAIKGWSIVGFARVPS